MLGEGGGGQVNQMGGSEGLVYQTSCLLNWGPLQFGVWALWCQPVMVLA